VSTNFPALAIALTHYVKEIVKFSFVVVPLILRQILYAKLLGILYVPSRLAWHT